MVSMSFSSSAGFSSHCEPDKSLEFYLLIFQTFFAAQNLQSQIRIRLQAFAYHTVFKLVQIIYMLHRILKKYQSVQTIAMCMYVTYVEYLIKIRPTSVKQEMKRSASFVKFCSFPLGKNLLRRLHYWPGGLLKQTARKKVLNSVLNL